MGLNTGKWEFRKTLLNLSGDRCLYRICLIHSLALHIPSMRKNEAELNIIQMYCFIILICYIIIIIVTVIILNLRYLVEPEVFG